MNVSCTSCDVKYVVPDEKVAGRRIRIRCRHCDAPIVIDGTSIAAPASTPSSAGSASSSNVIGAPSSPATEPAAAGRTPQTPQLADLPPGESEAHAASASGTTGTPRRRRVRSEFSRTMVGGFAPAAGSAPEPPLAAPPPSVPAVAPNVRTAPERPPEPESSRPQTSRWAVALPEGVLEDASTEQVVQLFGAGRIADDVVLWKEGMDQWHKPFDIPEIKLALLARGFTPPIAREAAPTSHSRAPASVAPSSTASSAPSWDLDHGHAPPASPRQMRRPQPEPVSALAMEAPLPSDWQSVFDRPSHGGLVPAHRVAASRSHHPPSSVPPPTRNAALGASPAERRPATVSLPSPPLSTRPPSLRPVAAAASASRTSSRPAPPRSRAPAAASQPPPPLSTSIQSNRGAREQGVPSRSAESDGSFDALARSGASKDPSLRWTQGARRAGAVPLPAAVRQRQSSELDIQIDVDAPRPGRVPMPLPRQGPAAAVGPMLVAPSLPEVTYPHPPRRWTLWHLLLVLIVLSALAAVVVRMTHRPTVLYTATSAAVDRVKALLPR